MWESLQMERSAIQYKPMAIVGFVCSVIPDCNALSLSSFGTKDENCGIKAVRVP